MPYEVACELKKNREEKPDQHELSEEHLLMAEEAYKEIADIYSFKTIECSNNGLPRSIEEIGEELYTHVNKGLVNNDLKISIKRI